MKLEWHQLEVVLLERRQELIAQLCIAHTGHDITQYLRGQIVALNWVLDTPHRAHEEAEFERQRESVSGY